MLVRLHSLVFRPAQRQTVAAELIDLCRPTNLLRELDPLYVNHPVQHYRIAGPYSISTN